MKIRLAFALLFFATPLGAQTGVRPPQGWSLGLFAGGAAFTDFQRATTTAVTMNSGGQMEERRIAERIGAETSGAIAGTIAFWPSKNWGFRVRAAYAPSQFETIIPESDARAMSAAQSSDEGTELASLSITSYEGQLLFRMPTIRGRIMPYGIAGGGVVRYSAGGDRGPLPAEAEQDFQSGTRQRGAVTVGLGAALALRPKGWAMHFELTDQISGTPVTGSTTDRVRTTSSVAFMVGASWTLSK